MSAMILHLKLDRPSATPNPENKDQNILIWGGGSSFGIFCCANRCPGMLLNVPAIPHQTLDTLNIITRDSSTLSPISIHLSIYLEIGKQPRVDKIANDER